MAVVGGEVETPEGTATRATESVRKVPRHYLPRLCSMLREHLHTLLDNTDWFEDVAMAVRGGGVVEKAPPL